MNNYTIKFPAYTIGCNVFENIDKICTPYGRNIVVIGGKKALSEVEEKLKKVLVHTNLYIVEALWYGGECCEKNINQLVKQVADKSVDMIFGVGGGRALDTAKAVANKLQKPIFTIPTIAATCAATTKLSVVYNEQGIFDTFYFYEAPPVHVFIDDEIIAKAPKCYLRAGIGDTLAKHYECVFASRGRKLDHNSGLAVAMSRMCVTPLLEHGEKALKDCEHNEVSFDLEQVILANIVTTGFVSMLIEEDYNGAVAHSLFYGLTTLPHIEEKYLHGDVVGYGVLVQLMMEQQLEEVQKLYDFYKQIGIPVALKDIEVTSTQEVLMSVLENVVTQPDMEVLPYKVTKEMLFDAVQKIEQLG